MGTFKNFEKSLTKPKSLSAEKSENLMLRNTYKQAGTGPSRRHIQGSKIAKRLPSVKYSFTVVENTISVGHLTTVSA